MRSNRPNLRLIRGEGSMIPEEEPFWLPRVVPSRSLDDNAHYLARPLWGKPRAEWAMCLAMDLVAVSPGLVTERGIRECTAAILWAAAVAEGMQRGSRWEEALDDICAMTGVSRETARKRWHELIDLGLARPPAGVLGRRGG